MKVETKEIRTKRVDDRGRVSVGSSRAGKEVVFAILEVNDPDDSDDSET